MDIRRRVLFSLMGGDEDMKPIETFNIVGSRFDCSVTFSKVDKAFAVFRITCTSNSSTTDSTYYNDLVEGLDFYLLSGESIEGIGDGFDSRVSASLTTSSLTFSCTVATWYFAAIGVIYEV